MFDASLPAEFDKLTPTMAENLAMYRSLHAHLAPGTIVVADLTRGAGKICPTKIALTYRNRYLWIFVVQRPKLERFISSDERMMLQSWGPEATRQIPESLRLVASGNAMSVPAVTISNCETSGYACHTGKLSSLTVGES